MPQEAADKGPLPPEDFNPALVERAGELSAEVLAPRAAAVDRTRSFPEDGLAALCSSPMAGLLVPRRLGGAGASYGTLIRVLEHLGAGCPSSALCFLMHCCAGAVLARAARQEQVPRLLEPVARGRALATLAQSEEAGGGDFFAPRLRARQEGDRLVIDGRKSFVTSGGHADLYLVLLASASFPGGLEIVAVEGDRPGVSFEGEWDGMGMAGNGSVTLCLDGVSVPGANLLAGAGEAERLLFGTSARAFLLGLAGLSLGIARAALGHAVERAKGGGDGRTAPGEHQAIRFHLAEMYAVLTAAREAGYRAAGEQDRRRERGPDLPGLFAAKLLASQAAARVTDLSLQVWGGQGYRRSRPVERLYRDARAAAVMSPTSERLKDWIGKTLLGMPVP